MQYYVIPILINFISRFRLCLSNFGAVSANLYTTSRSFLLIYLIFLYIILHTLAPTLIHDTLQPSLPSHLHPT